MRRKNFWRKIVSELSIISILLNSILPFGIASRAYAQETIPATTIELSSPTPSDSPIPSATPENSPLPTATPSASPEPLPAPSPTATPIANETPTPTQTPSQWTFEKVELNKEYVSPQNGEVKLTFTKLPDPAGNIKIEEITLTQEQIEQTGSLSDKAYDITSDMKDGEFTYNLSLPIPESSKGKTVEVKFAEELSNINSAEKVENTLTKTDTSVSVTDLDHFTIFVITGGLNPGCSNVNGTVVGAVTISGSDQCYSTIQAAIDAASAGDTIIVADGTYTYESEGSPAPKGLIKVTKGVTIKAAEGVRPVIDGSGFDGVFKIHPSALLPGNTVIIEGFEIIGNEATSIAITTQGSYDVVPAKVIIRDNWFHGMVGGIDFWGAGGYLPSGWTSGVINTEITGNKFYDMVTSGTDQGFGVMIEDPINLVTAGDYAVKIENNEFSNIPSSGSNPGLGIVISRADGVLEASNVYIAGNSFTSVPVGIAIDGTVSIDVTDTKIINNDLSGTTLYGIMVGNIVNGPVNATENWWGSAVKATIQSKISGNVTFEAYYVDSGKTILNTDTVSELFVDDNYSEGSSDTHIFSYDAFATIQEGVDAVVADGIVNVAAGTYNESQILIDKPLTLQGVGKEDTIIDGGGTSTGGLVKITASSGTVTLSGFTIQNTNNSDDHGHGVYVDNAGVTVNISDNAIKNVGPVGINIHAAASVQIERNIISALYSTPDVVPNGIQIYNESFSGMGITGTIKDNEIKDSSWVGYDADADDYESNTTAAGILIIDTTAALEISNNNIHNNNVGIDIEAGSPTNIENNDIHDNAYGVVLWNENPSINNNIIENNSTAGVYEAADGTFSGTVNATNNWWGSDNPDFASITSGDISYDPWWMDSAMTLPSTLIAIFEGIHTTLEGLGIANNIDTCSTHPNTCTGLYFEKSVTVGEMTTKMGRLTFTAELDLSSDATQTFLQNLGSYMEANPGSMKFDADLATQMKEAGAEIIMYGVDELGYIHGTTPIIVKDNDGNILSEGDTNYPTLSSIEYVADDGGTIIFTTEHFTQFDLPDQDQTTPDDSGDATLSGDTTQVVLTDPNQDVTIDIADGTDNPTIDVSAFITGGQGDIPQITINSDDSNNVDVVIPATTVTGPADWNGVIAAPTITTVTLPETSGETKTLSLGIEIGFTDAKLSFANAVKITLPGQAGKKAGYSRPGTDFTEITTTCVENSQTWADANLGTDGECKVDVGSDLIIWTKHFTKFAAYSQTTNSTSDDSNSSSSSSDTGSATTTCNDAKPSTPTLLQAIAGTNSVRLVWSEGLGSLTYYLVTYGTASGLQQYGNQNIGGPGTTSYTINSLSGGTRYYFKIRAGNGCATGDFSNELSAIPTGEVVDVTPEGFVPASEVLGEETTVSPSPSASPASPNPSSDAGAVLGATLSPLRILLGKWWFWLAIVSLGAIGYFFIRKPGDNR